MTEGASTLARSAGASPAQVVPSKRPGHECCVSFQQWGHEAYTAVAWGVGVSHEMMNSRERRLCSWSNATCAMPLGEALSSRRGRGPHHAHKDRVGTWDISYLAVT